jgi:hypothetical protein
MYTKEYGMNFKIFEKIVMAVGKGFLAGLGFGIIVLGFFLLLQTSLQIDVSKKIALFSIFIGSFCLILSFFTKSK